LENKESLVEVPLPSIIHKIEKNMPAFASGMREGDEITAINGVAVSTYNEVFNIIPTVRGKVVPVSVLRDGQAMTFKVDLTTDPQFGIRSLAADSIYEVRSEKFGFFASIPEAFSFASETVSNQIKSFQKIFSGEVSARKSLGGPIAIAKDLYGGTWIWQKFWLTTALLSIVLAFMNLLPIPALDGGHALFTLIEIIFRRPLSTKFLTYAQYAGMVIIFGLMIFIIGNDLLKLFL
jgi:regulator of sigma E protease